jgi:cell volume regulation protein A
MLLGAIFASTDAAAVFLLLRQRGVRLSPSMSGTLEVESGMNDPMAIFLTLTCVQLIIGYEEADGVLIVGDFLWQMGSGIVAGLVGGKLMRWFFRYAEEASGLNSIFVLSGALMIFGATNMAGGSGFLAVYLAGLMLGNADALPLKPVRQFMDGMGWLSQLVMLLVLGLLATPTELIGDIPAALVIAGLLIFVARPVAVFLSLAFERFNWREKLFISWVGLRGAIPIYLATIPVMMGLEGRYFNLAFIVVICSLFLQGWTIRPVAGLLGVARQPRDQASSGQ